MRIRSFLVVLLSGFLIAGFVPSEPSALAGTDPEEPAASDPQPGATPDSTVPIDAAPPSSPPVGEGAAGSPVLEVTTTDPLEAAEEALDSDIPVVRTPKID